MVAPDAAPSVKNRLVKGFAWTLASRVVFNALSFIYSIVLARLLMPEDFGIVAVALGIFAIVQALTTMPIAEALIQTQEVDNDHVDSAFTLGLVRSTLFAVLLAAAAWPTTYFYGDSRLAGFLLALGFGTLCSGFFSPRWPLIQKDLSFGPTFVLAAGSRVIGIAASLPVAYYYHSPWALILSMVASQILGVLITHYYVPYRFRFSTRRIKDLWSFSIWMTFSTILNTVNSRIDTLLLGAFLGHRAVGYYSYADDKAALPAREMTGPMVQVLFPGLAAVKDDRARLASSYKRVQSLIFALCAPASIGLALVAEPFVHVLLGEKWMPIVPIIQILATVLALENLAVAAGPLAMAQGRTRDLFHRDIVNFALRVPAITAGLFFFGLAGVLAARAFATVCSTLLYMRLVRKVVGVSVWEQLSGCGRTFGACLVMSAAVLLFQRSSLMHVMPGSMTLIVSIVLGGFAYLVGHALIWQLAGRPHGPEAEIGTIMQDFLRKRAARRAMPVSEPAQL